VRRAARDSKVTSGGARRRGAWWVATGITVVGVVILSLGPDVNPHSALLDHLAHVAAYAVLAAVLLAARDPHGAVSWPSMFVLAAGIVSFGAAMEFAQAAFHRDATVADGVADAIGVSVALGAYALLRVIRQRREWDSKETMEPGLRSNSSR
jgi:VanZ family protein